MTVATHQASAQMLGYLYQVRCSLDLLLSDANEQLSICIEKFDDIAFSNDGENPSVLIQTKHHINGHGDLSDKSVDLWRTINVWIDHLSTYELDNTKFIILTTATAPENSAASLLRIRNRNAFRAIELLKQASQQSNNKTNIAFYTAFNKIQPNIVQQLFECILVIDNSANIIDVVERIKHSIRYSTRPEFEDQVFERVEGWWFGKIIKALCSDAPVFISQRELRSKICDVAGEYSLDNLPIDTVSIVNIDVESFPRNERLFCEQLRLIAVKENRINMAIRDYYRAFTQRSQWVQDYLLYIEELDKYDCRLIDEWEHLFARMGDELDTNSSECEKQEAGRSLYNHIEYDTDIRIRPLCSDAFVMRGSYHMLSDKRRVGWHLDFAQCLAETEKDGDCL